MTETNHGSSQLRKGRFSQQGGLYFLTKTLLRPGAFTEEQRTDVCEAICHFRDAGEICLHAFVVMPDHWHALLSLTGDKTLDRLLRDISARASYPTRISGEEIG